MEINEKLCRLHFLLFPLEDSTLAPTAHGCRASLPRFGGGVPTGSCTSSLVPSRARRWRLGRAAPHAWLWPRVAGSKPGPWPAVPSPRSLSMRTRPRCCPVPGPHRSPAGADAVLLNLQDCASGFFVFLRTTQTDEDSPCGKTRHYCRPHIICQSLLSECSVCAKLQV